MIDTIVLTLNQSDFKITNHNRFTPSTKSLIKRYKTTQGYKGKSTHIQYPTKEERRNGIIKPALTVYQDIRKSGPEIFLKIEVSLSKLFLGNNIEELFTKDFNLITMTLVTVIKDMGIIVNSKSIKNSKISAIHYSKNIIFHDYITPAMVINEISKCQCNKRVDLTEEKYINGGEALRYHYKNHEIIFYDKLKEIIHSTYPTTNVKHILKSLANKPDIQILRIEIRLNKRRKIKQILNKIGFNSEIIFSNLFDEQIAKNILLYHWDSIISKSMTFFRTNVNAIEKLEQLRRVNPNISYLKLLAYVGQMFILKDANIKRLRNTLQYSTDRDYKWYKIQSNLKDIINCDEVNFSTIPYIEKALNEFKMIRLEDI